MGTRGGPRPGSGRPKGKENIQKQIIRERIKTFVEANLDPILEAMKNKACGCAIIDRKDDTGEKIYDLPPDPQAAKILIEHAAGKPPESVQLSGTGKDGEFLIKWE